MHSTYLPWDVLRIIFELSAVEDTGMGLRLAHVSRTVNRWMNPNLYHTVFLKTRRSVTAFAYAVGPTHHIFEPKTFKLGRFVRSLAIHTSGDAYRNWGVILRSCSTLRSLTLSMKRGSSSRRLAKVPQEILRPMLQRKTSPVRLFFHSWTIFHDGVIDFTRQLHLFKNVTHLEIVGDGPSSPTASNPLWKGFKDLTSLTHFCMTNPNLEGMGHLNELDALVETFPPSLLVFLIRLGAGTDGVRSQLNVLSQWLNGAGVEIDPRMVFSFQHPAFPVCSSYKDYMFLEKSTSRAADWEAAKDAVMRRRAKGLVLSKVM